MDKVVFLGYLVSEHTISPAPALLEAIDRLVEPTNKSEIKSVVGVMSYPRKCIEKFSINMEPIIRLNRKDVP